MNSGPKIKIPLTKNDKILGKISFLLLIFLWVITLYSFTKLPEIFPIHFDASGRPDNYGNKWGLFLLPIMASLLYAGLTYLIKNPRVFNYAVQLTEDNAEGHYSAATRMLRVLKCSFMVIFSLLGLYSYWTTEGKTEKPGWWFIPLVLGIIFIPLIFILQKIRKDSRKFSFS